METEVKDDWHHRVSAVNRGATESPSGADDVIKGGQEQEEEAPKQVDALDLLIDFVENAL